MLQFTEASKNCYASVTADAAWHCNGRQDC